MFFNSNAEIGKVQKLMGKLISNKPFKILAALLKQIRLSKGLSISR